MIVKGYKIKSYANLRNANLSYANLNNADLYNANLSYANLSYANLSKADLSYANLSYADLRDADIRGADIDYSNWPLWCGSFGVIIDERQAKQLLVHAFDAALKFWPGGLTDEQKLWLNSFHQKHKNF